MRAVLELLTLHDVGVHLEEVSADRVHQPGSIGAGEREDP